MRTNSSSVSHVGIDDAGTGGVFFLTAVFSFFAGISPWFLANQKVASPLAFYTPAEGSPRLAMNPNFTGVFHEVGDGLF